MYLLLTKRTSLALPGNNYLTKVLPLSKNLRLEISWDKTTSFYDIHPTQRWMIDWRSRQINISFLFLDPGIPKILFHSNVNVAVMGCVKSNASSAAFSPHRRNLRSALILDWLSLEVKKHWGLFVTTKLTPTPSITMNIITSVHLKESFSVCLSFVLETTTSFRNLKTASNQYLHK